MSNSLPSGRTAGNLTVLEHDPEWSARFAELGGRLRSALGAVALRIDHIGSTAVPGLAAKPIIDVQVSVASLEPVDPYRSALEECGFVWRTDNPERTKRYFRERPGDRRTHVHVRRAGSFSEQFALLFPKDLAQQSNGWHGAAWPGSRSETGSASLASSSPWRGHRLDGRCRRRTRPKAAAR